MADISISIDSRAVNSLLTRAPDRLAVAMRGAMEDSTTYVLAIAKRYPPQRAGSTYRRTNTLMRSWSRRVEGSGLDIRGIIGSNSAMAPYNRLVMSREHQARIHRGRWETIENIGERAQPRVQGFFTSRIQAALGGL